MSRIQKWCEDHGYSDNIADLIRELASYGYTEDRTIDVLNRAHELHQECGISIQETLAHLIFLEDRY